MLGVTALQAGSFTKQLIARQYRKNKFRRAIVATIMLTSMIDMFSLLVIFLLQSFSTSNEVLTLKEGIVLPPAITGSAPTDAPILSIALKDLVLDSESFGTPDAVMNAPEKFLGKLETIRTAWTKAHPSEAFKGAIHLEADKDISSALVSQVISMLTSRGYATVHLAVVAGR